MISSIHSIFNNNKKIIDFVEGESVTERDIKIVNAELIRELEELYEDNEEAELT